MRFVVIWNVMVTSLLAILLLSHLHDRLHKTPTQASSTQADVIRVRRVDVVDHDGHLTAVLGEGTDGYASEGRAYPARCNWTEGSHSRLDGRGYGNLWFASKRYPGQVSVGYFRGGDQGVPLSEEDPRGAWGIRVSKNSADSSQVFGVQVAGRPIPASP